MGDNNSLQMSDKLSWLQLTLQISVTVYPLLVSGILGRKEPITLQLAPVNRIPSLHIGY